jgi:hypothetical protein
MRAAKKVGKRSRRKPPITPSAQIDPFPVLTISQLRKELERANQLPKSTPGERRLAMAEAILVIWRFLQGSPEIPDKSVINLLRDLFWELQSVDRGTRSKIFTPPKLGHRPPASLSEEFCAAISAAAVDVLVHRARRSPNDAAREVAEVCRRVGRSTLTQKVILSNRQTFSRTPRSMRVGMLYYGVARDRYLAEFHGQDERTIVSALKKSLEADMV